MGKVEVASGLSTLHMRNELMCYNLVYVVSESSSPVFILGFFVIFSLVSMSYAGSIC